jgi:Fic family protein
LGERFEPRYSISDLTTAGIAHIERARGFLEAAKLSEPQLESMRSRAFVLEAHHTTHIEGTRLTLEQSERLLAGEAVSEADPEDVRELFNYREAFEFVSEGLATGQPVTEAAIREIHRRLVQGVRGGAGEPGRYRRIQNYVVHSRTGAVVYTPPPPRDVPEMMRQLVEWLNASKPVHAVLESGIAQFQLVHIHPFVDGNGRTSRLLSTLCLYRAGYDFKRLFSLSEFYDRDRTAFYAAIQGVRASGMDMTGWIDFFVKGLATQTEEVKERGTRAIRSDSIARRFGLIERQRRLVFELLEGSELDLDSARTRMPDVPRRTLQRDLQQLVREGIAVALGETRRRRYRLSDNAL